MTAALVEPAKTKSGTPTAVFDMDGALVRGNDYGKRLYVTRNHSGIPLRRQIFNAVFGKFIDWGTRLTPNATMKSWTYGVVEKTVKGLPKSVFEAKGDYYDVRDRALELLKGCFEAGYECILVTQNFKPLADRLVEFLHESKGFEPIETYGVELAYDGGAVSGFNYQDPITQKLVQGEGKEAVFEYLEEKEGYDIKLVVEDGKPYGTTWINCNGEQKPAVRVNSRTVPVVDVYAHA